MIQFFSRLKASISHTIKALKYMDNIGNDPVSLFMFYATYSIVALGYIAILLSIICMIAIMVRGAFSYLFHL